jgi:anti-anti-sigma factor
MMDRASRRQVHVAPQEPLVAGGPAEEYERQVNALFRSGCRHLIADLRAVSGIDSAGVRALVRSHTTAQRVGGAFTLVAPQPRVREVLQLSHLESVFDIRESLDAARVPGWRFSSLRLILPGAALCIALAWAGTRWSAPVGGAIWSAPLLPFAQQSASPWLWLAIALVKLVAAGSIGLLVTAVQRRFHDKPMTQAMEHAQILLCVSGALVMMIIGESLARAFGIAGAASIIRFRTPIEDPKDITILFLLMALGMATGIGAFEISGAGTAFLCVFLVVLEHVGGGRRRTMTVEISAPGRDFPLNHVHGVFARNHVVFEPREVIQKKEAVMMVFHATLDPDLSLEDVSAQLVDRDSGISSVSWESPRRNG